MTEMPHIEDEQRRIAELLHSFDVPAPEPLHRRIESLVASHQNQFAPRSPGLGVRRFSPFGLASAGAVAAAVVAVAVVTWLRDGHLCVVSGRGVSSATLLRLASWSDHDATVS